jgi:hypothetical protein
MEKEKEKEKRDQGERKAKDEAIRKAAQRQQVGNEPEDEDSMHGLPNASQEGSSPDWLAQSIKQSVADWKKLLHQSKQGEELKSKPKPSQPSNPYVEEFSSKKFSSGTLEFMKLEKQLREDPEDKDEGVLDPFSDPMLVPKSLPIADPAREVGSYAQAFQKQKLEKIQLEIYKNQVEEKLSKPQSVVKVLDQKEAPLPRRL